MKRVFANLRQNLILYFDRQRRLFLAKFNLRKIDLNSWNHPSFDKATKIQILCIGLASLFLLLFYAFFAGRQVAALALGNYGFYLNAERQWTSALRIFETSIWLAEGTDSYSYFGKAYAESQLGRFKSALRDYQTAEILAADNACIYNNEGLTYERLGDDKNALAAYNQSAQLAPKHAEHYVDRGKLLRRLGRDKDALRDFSAADQIVTQKLKEHPQEANNLADKASVLYELGNYQQAATNIEKAINKKNNPDFLLVRAKIFLALNQLSPALADIDQYLEASPFDAEGYLQLAKILDKRGDTAKAGAIRKKISLLKEEARKSG